MQLISKLAIYISREIKGKIGLFLGKDKVVLHGIRINLKHNNISPELRKFFYKGTYEGQEISILKKHLKMNDIIMEIGAGIGFLSTYCAKQIGSGKVFAYEANPFMIDKIKESYTSNKVSPTIKNLLLSDKEDSINFYLEKDFWSSSTVKRSDDAKCLKVKGIKINDEIKNINPTFLIIDIEGGEKELIPLIDFNNNRIQKILIEIHPHIIGEYEASKVLAYFVLNGFSLKFKDSIGDVFLFERMIYES